MKALTLIYSHRVPGFKETQIGFDSIQKRNPIPKGSRKRVCSRPAGRPTHATVDRAGRPGPTESSLLSVGRPGRSIAIFLCTFVHAGRPGGRPASSTDRPGGRPGAQSGLLQYTVLLLLISDLCATFLYSSISSLPTFASACKYVRGSSDHEHSHS